VVGAAEPGRTPQWYRGSGPGPKCHHHAGRLVRPEGDVPSGDRTDPRVAAPGSGCRNAPRGGVLGCEFWESNGPMVEELAARTGIGIDPDRVPCGSIF